MVLLRRKRLPNGSFGPLEKVFDGETDKEKIEQLELENAELWYDIMNNVSQINEHENDISSIWYEIMIGGAS